jgi:hypothetical protein
MFDLGLQTTKVSPERSAITRSDGHWAGRCRSGHWHSMFVCV